MGYTRARSSTLDLFSTAPAREPASAVLPTSPHVRRHVLPNDLPNAVRQLEDKELEQLFSAVLAEQKRRGKGRPDTDGTLGSRRIERTTVPLTQGKLNAVRAAFKAGVTPSRIARQFGISQSDVRKALASDIIATT
jgi:DNA invertase Pin-like site-specific DNA recombinase